MHPQTDRFKALFICNPIAYTQVKNTGVITPEGKTETKSYLEKNVPLTDSTWSNHLNGRTRLGLLPIKEDLSCHWCCIDIDIYKEKIPVEEIMKKVIENNLPFHPFTSKSGAIHLWIFFSEPINCAHIAPKLRSFASFFGLAKDSEIFPNQITLDRERPPERYNYGSAMNIPYYGGNTSLQYTCDEKGEALSLEAFLDVVDSWKVSEKEFLDLSVPEPKYHAELFPDGPPCLNRLFGDNSIPMEMRNAAMCGATVYWMQASLSSWREELNKLNSNLFNPLDDRELSSIKDSYSPGKFFYSCDKKPMQDYCDPTLCKTRKYGIGAGQIVSVDAKLTKLCTDPPLWYMNIGDDQITLSTEELYNFAFFSKKHMEVLDIIPKPVKQATWIALVNDLLKTVHKIEIDQSMTPVGMLSEIMEEWIANRASLNSFDDIMNKIPYRETAGDVYFRMRDLMDYLSTQRTITMKQNQITSIIKLNFKGEKCFKQIQGKGVNLWRMPPHTKLLPAQSAQPAIEMDESEY